MFRSPKLLLFPLMLQDLVQEVDTLETGKSVMQILTFGCCKSVFSFLANINLRSHDELVAHA